MRILCTVLKPTSGVAELAGFDVATQASQVRQNIGFLSASTAIRDAREPRPEGNGGVLGAASMAMTPERLRERMETVFATLTK